MSTRDEDAAPYESAVPEADARGRGLVRLQVAIAGVSATLLALQVAFTRVLSVVVDFHMVFLVLSVAMLGVGLPGAWLLWRPPGERTVVRALYVAAIGIPGAIVALLRLGTPNLDRTLPLAIVCLIVPFMSLGTAAVALLLEAEGESFRRVYAADLLGGALGALGIIALLDRVPTPTLVAGLALPVLALIVWLEGWRQSGAAALIGAAVLGVVGWGAPLRVHFTKVYDESTLSAHVIAERWSSTTRLAVFDHPIFFTYDAFFTWGPGRNAPPFDVHREYWIEQDGSAGTPVMQFDGDLGKLASLDYDVTSLGFQLRPAGNVLVVGPGGGRDILSALRQGASRIQAVEINRGMIELMKGPLATFSGDLYADPRVTVKFAEARSYLASTDARFDAIQISLIDSWAATAAGAHALSEGYLYTVEAVETYLRKLSPHGVLSISRWDGLELSRLLSTVAAAAAAEGWSSIGEHLLVQKAGGIATVVASPDPFSAEERAHAKALSELRGWDVLHPVPGSAASTCLDSGGARCTRSPSVDDKPFFFIFEPALTLAHGSPNGLGRIRQVAMLALAGLFLSLVFPFLRGTGEVSPRALSGGFYYVLIGVGFMLVEVGLTHRFVEYVGHPTTSASAVLTGLLLGAGIGSYVLPARSRREWLVGTSLVIALVGLGAPWVFVHTRALGPEARGLIAALLTATTAIQLGAWFPAGLLRWGDAHKAWFWLVNGTASVAGGMLAIGIAIDFGFRILFLSAAALYLAAGALLLVGARVQQRA